MSKIDSHVAKGSRLRTLTLVMVMTVAGLAAGVQSAWAGTANGSAKAKGGETTIEVTKKKGTDTGAMEVKDVIVNGTPLKSSQYTIKRHHSTQVVVELLDPLAADDHVEVKLSTIKKGTFDVNVALS